MLWWEGVVTACNYRFTVVNPLIAQSVLRLHCYVDNFLKTQTVTVLFY